MKNFSVIGAGNLGCHLIESLIQRDYNLKYVYKKSKSTQFKSAIISDIDILIEESDFIIISTQESKIKSAVQSLTRSTHLKNKIFLHTSNFLTSDELIKLKDNGAKVGSFSPLQTFPEYRISTPYNSQVFKDIYFLTEGDEEAVSLSQQLGKELKAKVLLITKKEKALFHIAGVAASNFFVAVLKLAERQLKKVKKTEKTKNQSIDINILLPLVKQTLKNIETRGVEASLTGPIKRGELGVVNKHLKILEKDPLDAKLYQEISEFLLKTLNK